jgi:hypothetical protein
MQQLDLVLELLEPVEAILRCLFRLCSQIFSLILDLPLSFGHHLIHLFRFGEFELLRELDLFEQPLLDAQLVGQSLLLLSELFRFELQLGNESVINGHRMDGLIIFRNLTTLVLHGICERFLFHRCYAFPVDRIAPQLQLDQITVALQGLEQHPTALVAQRIPTQIETLQLRVLPQSFRDLRRPVVLPLVPRTLYSDLVVPQVYRLHMQRLHLQHRPQCSRRPYLSNDMMEEGTSSSLRCSISTFNPRLLASAWMTASPPESPNAQPDICTCWM